MRPFEAASETPARRGWWAGSGWQPRYVRAARAGPGLRRAAAPAWWCRCRSAGCPARTGKREAEEARLRPGAAGLFGDGAQRSAAGRGQPHGGIAGVAAPRGRLSPRQDGPRPGRAEQSCPAELGRAANGVPAAGPAPRLGGGTARFPVSAARLRRLTWALVPGLFRLSTAVPSAMTIVTAAPGPGCGGAGRGGGRGAGASGCWAGRGGARSLARGAEEAASGGALGLCGRAGRRCWVSAARPCPSEVHRAEGWGVVAEAGGCGGTAMSWATRKWWKARNRAVPRLGVGTSPPRLYVGEQEFHVGASREARCRSLWLLFYRWAAGQSHCPEKKLCPTAWNCSSQRFLRGEVNNSRSNCCASEGYAGHAAVLDLLGSCINFLWDWFIISQPQRNCNANCFSPS